MTRIDALKALLANVEAGDWNVAAKPTATLWPEGKIVGAKWVHEYSMVYAAFHGSLDAALALHEAVLPGWGWSIESGEAAVWHPETKGVSRDICVAKSSARAWLLAILKALIAQEESR